MKTMNIMVVLKCHQIFAHFNSLSSALTKRELSLIHINYSISITSVCYGTSAKQKAIVSLCKLIYPGLEITQFLIQLLLIHLLHRQAVLTEEADRCCGKLLWVVLLYLYYICILSNKRIGNSAEKLLCSSFLVSGYRCKNTGAWQMSISDQTGFKLIT